jgi:hypothetical protein
METFEKINTGGWLENLFPLAVGLIKPPVELHFHKRLAKPTTSGNRFSLTVLS